MGIDIKKGATLAFVFLALTYSTCKKSDCSQSIYSFTINIKAYPDQDNINIDDTIWLELNEPTKLKDLHSGNEIDYSNAGNIGSSISFLEFIGGSINDPGVTGAVNFFDCDLVIGKNVPNSLTQQVKEYTFTETQGMFQFKVGVIAKKKGVFGLVIGNASNVYRRNDKCTKAGFAITFKNTSQHLYFLEQNRPGYAPSGLELTNMYCFKVK